MNKRLLFWLMILIGVLIAIILFTSGCRQVKKPIDNKPQVPSITVLDEGAVSAVESYQTVVIDDQETYQNFLSTNQLMINSPVDLRETTVIALFMGFRPSGGYSINVTKIEEKNDMLYVHVVQRIPGENCINIQMITYPYQVVSIPKTNLPIEIISENDIYDCP
jgi:hypothetical protein